MEMRPYVRSWNYNYKKMFKELTGEFECEESVDRSKNNLVTQKL
jgi:hypothetical protein